ncbi:WD40-repeat-containing domain protein [Pilobolus umbonatus]|nr:WD40-repeat-containing domain protein [Pilobolus umbonatus]
MSTALYQYLQQRQGYGTRLPSWCRTNKKSIHQHLYADEYTLSQMTLDKQLPGHTGCVNTLEWSVKGDKLLTGSDDKKLNIYYTYEDYKMKASIDTGHRANIFTAKFMPLSSDSIIVSGAGDSEIRIFDLNKNASSPLTNIYTCHSEQVKTICTYNNNPNEFLSCAQDGRVVHCDLREPHKCSSRNRRPWITSVDRQSTQYSSQTGHIKEGCPKPLIDYSVYNIELNSMSVSQLYPHYFAVAGSSDYIFLHDRRMSSSTSSMSNIKQSSDKLKCVKKFGSSYDIYNRPNKHITACRFSDSNGYEIIGNWSSDGIYLFDIRDSPVETSENTLFSSNHSDRSSSSSSSPDSNNNHSNSHLSPNSYHDIYLSDAHTSDALSSSSDRHTSDSASTESIHFEAMPQSSQEPHSPLSSFEKWCVAADLYCNSSIDGAIRILDTLRVDLRISNLYNSAQQNEESDHIENRLLVLSTLILLSCTRLQRAYDTNYIDANETEDDRIALKYQELCSARHFLEMAEEMAPGNDQSNWILAIGYCVAGLTTPPNNTYTREYLRKARLFYERTDSFLSTLDNSSHSSSSEHSLHSIGTLFEEDLREAYRARSLYFNEDEMNNDQDNAMDYTLDSDTGSNDTSAPFDASKLRTKWIRTLSNQYIIPLHDHEDTASSSSSTASSPHLSPHAPESSDFSSNRMVVSTEENSDEEDEVSLFTHIMSSREILDMIHQYSAVSDSESDDTVIYNVNPFSHILESATHSDGDIIKHRSKYTGHCNIETTKEVGFYGLSDEYIVSGSDGGYVFIWDKKTTKIVQILQADEEVVNVVKGHPSLPIMAVSGIDSTPKIFTPTSRPISTSKVREPNNPLSYSTSSRMYEQDNIIEFNRERNREDNMYITRMMIAALSDSMQLTRVPNNADNNDF